MNSPLATTIKDQECKPCVSIITPVLNGERFIRQTVESVLSQTGDFTLEYIIRDGGSTDATLDILNEYRDDCTIISQKDSSPQEAICKGLDMAKGDILAWLGADDIYEANAIQCIVNAFCQNNDQLWAYGYCKIINEANKEIQKPITLYKKLLGYFYSKNVLLCENFVSQPATFWKKTLWDQINGMDTSLTAAWDYQLWLEMSKRSQAIPIRKTLACFRRHPGSISENHFSTQFAEELTIAKKYGNTLHYAMHAFNRWKIVFAYRILQSINNKPNATASGESKPQS